MVAAEKAFSCMFPEAGLLSAKYISGRSFPPPLGWTYVKDAMFRVAKAKAK
jgi:hypothetical protein